MSIEKIPSDHTSENLILPEAPDREEIIYTKMLCPEIVPKLCRLCLEEKQTMWPFFSVLTLEDGSSIDVSSIFQRLTGEDSEKMENPRLPSKMCEYCLDLLVNAYAFHRVYEETTQILNDSLASSLKIDENFKETEHELDQNKQHEETKCNQMIYETGPDITEEAFVSVPSEIQEKCKSPPILLESVICSKECTSEFKKHFDTHKTSERTKITKGTSAFSTTATEETKSSAVIIDIGDETENSVKFFKESDQIEVPTPEKTEPVPNLKENVEKTSKKLHRCPICPKEFTALELKKHCFSHKTLRTYLKSAPKYDKKVRFYAKPRRENKGLFNQEKIFHTCPFCQEEFESEAFRDHIKQHRIEGNFRCNICNRIFLGINHLKMHQLSHKKEAPFKCKICKKPFFLQSNYDFHLLKHTDDKNLPFKCDYCANTFSNPEHLKRHRFNHENDISYHNFYKRETLYFKCTQCLQKFKTEEERDVHNCKLCCAKCHHLFDSKSTFNSHVCKSKLKRSQCTPCGKVFQLPSSFKTHKFRCKSRTLCYVCGKNVRNITQHLSTHYPHKRSKTVYKCAQCDKQFSFKVNLSRHINEVHLNIVRFHCQYCSKGFKGKWNLQVHERIHGGDKAHVCNICGKGFLEKSYLKKHLRVHLRGCLLE